jgi:holo-[acyl-carrier protein] synthase
LEIENSTAFGIKKAHVSLSHDGDYAIAQVILES